MTNEALLAIHRASLGKVLNPRMIKSAKLALRALLIAIAGIATATAAQTAPVAGKNGATPHAKGTPNDGTALQVDPVREAWRDLMLKTHRSNASCATATYPDKQWHEVPCGPPPLRHVMPPKGIRQHTVGGGGDGAGPSLSVLNGSIMQAEGSFDKVEGVSWEKGDGISNAFSLQLNTNPFMTSTCKGAKYSGECMGWVQFIYDSSGQFSEIQYWLLFYRNGCPAGWTSDKQPDGSCLRNSPTISTPPVTISDLGRMRLYGSIGGQFGNPYDDVVAVQIGDNLYAQWSGDPIADATKSWQSMEFNVFGPPDGGGAVFNPGSTIVVRDSILIGTETGVACSELGWTQETNSLTMTNKSPLVASVGPPSLVFVESNATGTLAGDCSNAVVVQGSSRGPIKPIIVHKP
jgi:hypothetical protein